MPFSNIQAIIASIVIFVSVSYLILFPPFLFGFLLSYCLNKYVRCIYFHTGSSVIPHPFPNTSGNWKIVDCRPTKQENIAIFQLCLIRFVIKYTPAVTVPSIYFSGRTMFNVSIYLTVWFWGRFGCCFLQIEHLLRSLLLMIVFCFVFLSFYDGPARYFCIAFVLAVICNFYV